MILLLSTAAMGQQALMAVSEKPRPALTLKQFVTRPANAAILSAMAGTMAADAISTQQVLREGGVELNPLARPFVSSAKGQATISGLAFGSATAAAWLLERRGHPRWARATLIAATAGSLFCAVNNERIRR